MATSAEPAWALDELRRHLGETLGPSRAIVIDQARIDAFADITEDPQWIHVDSDRAATSPYGSTIAHGFLTLSLLSAFFGELVCVRDAASAVNYGLDRVRFPRPVRSGESVRATVELREIKDEGARVRLHSRVTIFAEAEPDRPCCVAEAITLFLREETE